MLIEELIRSCANEEVAEAAVASIGRRFYADVSDVAAACDLEIGAYTAQAVSLFVKGSSERDLRDIVAAMGASEQPILAGLQMLLSKVMAGETAGRAALPHLAGLARGASPAWIEA